MKSHLIYVTVVTMVGAREEHKILLDLRKIDFILAESDNSKLSISGKLYYCEESEAKKLLKIWRKYNEQY